MKSDQLVEVVDRTDCRFSLNDLASLRKTTRLFLDYLAEEKRKPYGNVCIALMGEQEIKFFNKKFLKANRPTDVLTFPDYTEEKRISGDVALCPFRVLLYSFQEHQIPTQWFYQTLLHGLLHLYGLKHDYRSETLKKIYRIQSDIIKKIKLNEENIDGIFEKILLTQGSIK